MIRMLPHALISFIFLLVPAIGAAMVVEGSAISGLPPNGVVVLDLGSGKTSVATADSNGEIQVVEEEDDDDGTLYIPIGTNGVLPLINAANQALLGQLEVNGPSISVYSDVWEIKTDGGDSRIRGYVDGGISSLYLNDLKNNTSNGAELAEADGFAVRSAADNSVLGYRLGAGLQYRTGDSWASKGSGLWQIQAGYTFYEDFEGEFTARAPGLTVRSSGKQEVESWDAAIGYEWFPADRFGIFANLGYAWYDTKDSGQIVRVEDGLVLSSFGDTRSDETATVELGVSYSITANLGVRLGYTYSFDEVGSSGSDEPESIDASMFYTFGL